MPAKGHRHSLGARRRIGRKPRWNQGLTKETDSRVRAHARKTSQTMAGRPLTQEHCRKLRGPKSPEHNEKVRQARLREWRDPEMRRKRLRGNRRRPTSLEKEVDALLEEVFPGQWSYCGGGQWTVLIGRYIPDFVHKSKMLLIEAFGDHWHTLPGAFQRDHLRLLEFSHHGYDTFVIWESELAKVELVRKLRLFCA